MVKLIERAVIQDRKRPRSHGPRMPAVVAMLAAMIVAPSWSDAFEQSTGQTAPSGLAAAADDPEDGQPNWGEPLLGLRMRLSAPRGSEYRRGVPLPLLIEMQNVTDTPIPFADLHRNCDFKVFDQKNQWLGMLAVTDEATKTAAIDKEVERDEPKQPASGGKSKKSTVVPKNSPSHLAKIKRLDQQKPGNIVWGKPRHGLAVGIGEIRTSVESPRRPIIHAYLENRGKAPIGGVMQTRARFVVELDKQFYVEADFGGPIGDIPAGKRFGPIVLVTDHFNKTPRLEPESVVDQTTPGPDLTAGNHALRLHYKLEGASGVNQLIASESITFSVSLEPYPVDAAVAKIVDALRHADRDVRRNAALAAGKLRLTGSRDALVGVLTDKDKIIRRYAAESLGAIGDDAATKPLRELLTDQEMEVRLAAAESLVKLGVPLEPSWVEPIIESKHRVFQNAIWLVRRHGGKQAARTLVRCLDFDDPSVNSYYNYTLVWQIPGCGGPDLKYMHDFDAKGTPKQIESNRRVLSTLKTWLDNQAPGEADPDQTRGGGPLGDGPSSVLAGYLKSSDENRQQKARVLGIMRNAQVVFLEYQRDTPPKSVEEEIAFAFSLKASSVEPRVRSANASNLPAGVQQNAGPPFATIQAVFSKYFGDAERATPDQWLAQMQRPITAGYKLNSITVVVDPSSDVKKRSLAESRTVATSVARKLAAIKQEFRQLDEFEESTRNPGNWIEGDWPRYASVAYKHDVGAYTISGYEKLSKNWCGLFFSVGPIKGFPAQRTIPLRQYPKQGIQAGWLMESGNDALNKKFNEIVTESLKELDTLERELNDPRAAANRDDASR